MNRPHPTAADLATARQRYEAEAKPGEFHTGRYNMRYVRWGAGKPVVFVHGLCDHPMSFALLMSEFVDHGYEVFCYHLANGQDDDAKLKTYTHDDFVEDLVAFLDHHQLGSVFIKGSSFGSTITLRALVKYPDRFRRVVLQGGFAYRKITGLEKSLSKLGRRWHFRMNRLFGRKVVMGFLEKPQFAGCPKEIVKYLAECSGYTPVSAAAHRALILSELDLRPQLKGIPHPVLMIGGDRDTIVPREFERTVEEGLPSVKRIEFSPCGHYPQYTMPAQMAEEMDRFFKETR